jgi:hypothetical protein
MFKIIITIFKNQFRLCFSQIFPMDNVMVEAKFRLISDYAWPIDFLRRSPDPAPGPFQSNA